MSGEAPGTTHFGHMSTSTPTVSRGGHKVIPQDRSNDRDGPDAIIRPGRQFPEHLSFSSLSSFAWCPASWALSRLDRRTPSTKLAKQRSVGNGTHQVLDLVSKGADVADAVASVSDSPSFDQFKPEITKMVERCVTWAPADPNRPSIIETEVKLKATIADHPILAFLDVIERDEDGVLVVADYKTGRPPRPVTEVTAGDPPETKAIYHASVTRQVVLYAEVAEANGRHIGRGRMIYPATETVIEVDLDDDRGRILRTEARQFVDYQAGRLAQSIRSGSFATKPSDSKCSGCLVAEGCPVGRAKLAEQAQAEAK